MCDKNQTHNIANYRDRLNSKPQSQLRLNSEEEFSRLSESHSTAGDLRTLQKDERLTEALSTSSIGSESSKNLH